MKKFLCSLAIALLAIHAHAWDIVVNAADIRPFCFEESGRQSGIALDILREVAKSTDLVAKSTYKKAGGDPAELRFGPTVGQPMHIYLGASRDFPPDDAQSIADAVGRLAKAGKIDAILDGYR